MKSFGGGIGLFHSRSTFMQNSTGLFTRKHTFLPVSAGFRKIFKNYTKIFMDADHFTNKSNFNKCGCIVFSNEYYADYITFL